MVDISQNREYADGELVPGTQYRVVRLIGAGGMGLVYEVEHLLLFRRFVLKAMHKSLTDREDLIARMHNELRALGRITHENIVDVSYAATSESGAPFYVMELLVGETLSQRMKRRRRLPFAEACRIAREILLGLAEAHRIGVIHRDVKPANIFMTRAEVVKVLDFGIAKVQDGSISEVTAHGLAIGTPRYMSPEQVAGSATTAQADLYAVGLLLFEMIAGEGPFDDVGDQRKTMLAHITKKAPRLSSRAAIPEDLDALVASALAKEPEERPASAEAMAEALARFAGPRTPGAWDGLAEHEETASESRSRASSAALDSNEPTLPKAVSIPTTALPSGDAATAREPKGVIEMAEISADGGPARTRTELLLPAVSPGEADAHEEPTRTSALPRRSVEGSGDATPSSVDQPLVLPPSVPPKPKGILRRLSTGVALAALAGLGAWVVVSRLSSADPRDGRTGVAEEGAAASEALGASREHDGAEAPPPAPPPSRMPEAAVVEAEPAEEKGEEKVEARTPPPVPAPSVKASPRPARAPSPAPAPKPSTSQPRRKKRMLPGSGL